MTKERWNNKILIFGVIIWFTHRFDEKWQKGVAKKCSMQYIADSICKSKITNIKA